MDLCEFKASLIFTVIPCFKKNKNKKSGGGWLKVSKQAAGTHLFLSGLAYGCSMTCLSSYLDFPSMMNSNQELEVNRNETTTPSFSGKASVLQIPMFGIHPSLKSEDNPY